MVKTGRSKRSQTEGESGGVKRHNGGINFNKLASGYKKKKKKKQTPHKKREKKKKKKEEKKKKKKKKKTQTKDLRGRQGILSTEA